MAFRSVLKHARESTLKIIKHYILDINIKYQILSILPRICLKIMGSEQRVNKYEAKTCHKKIIVEIE